MKESLGVVLAAVTAMRYVPRLFVVTLLQTSIMMLRHYRVLSQSSVKAAARQTSAVASLLLVPAQPAAGAMCCDGSCGGFSGFDCCIVGQIDF